jgi:NAD-dependent SIR2 family protein deacetylase
MDSKKISLPPQLMRTVRESRCLLFLGAGVSYNAGLPSGKDLSHILADQLKQDFNSGDTKKSQIEELESYRDDLKKISQLYQNYYGGRIVYNKISEILAEKERTARKDILEPLKHLNTVRNIITTNYDRLVENTLDPSDCQVVCKELDIREFDTPKRSLIKLHGTRTDPESMVLTTQDYDEYFKKHEAIIELTKTLFRQKTLIIVGYSLEDENFRQIFSQIEDYDKVKNFFVSPNVTLFQELHWEERGFQHVPLSAEEFFKALKETYDLTYKENTASFSERKTAISNPLFNPFTLYDTEALVEDRPQFLFDTFVSPVGFSTILEHQHTFIEGHRGSGKSTILWRLSIKSRAYNQDTDLPMWGFYIKMVNGLFSAFRRKRNKENEYTETNEEWIKYFTHYFNIIVLSGILQNLEDAVKLEIFKPNDELKTVVTRIAKRLLQLEEVEDIFDIRTLRISVDELLDKATNNRTEVSFYTTSTLIFRALDFLADAIPELREKHWHILLDEYDNIYPEQQAIVNIILRERNQKIRYKIAVKTLHTYLKDIDDKTLDPTDDFGYVSCDSAIWDRRLKPKYFGFIEKLSQQRLSYSNYNITIRELLPEAKEKNKYYAGFENFCYLSSGLTRLYLELCKDAIYEAYPDSATGRVELKAIPVSIQHHVVRIHSAILFKSYQGTPNPQRVFRLLRIFGSFFRAVAKATANQKEHRTPLSFEISNLDQLTNDSLEVLEETVKSRLIQLPTLPKQPRDSVKDSPAEKYSFHRLLAAFFKLSLKERYSEPVKANLFNDIWDNPDKVLKELAKGYKSKGIDKYLDKSGIDVSLPLFDGEIDNEEIEE